AWVRVPSSGLGIRGFISQEFHKTIEGEMKMGRWVLAAIAVVWAFGSAAMGATYYVDATNGNDTKDGQSTATAWKTIAKVNSSSFAPGDQILLKRGEVWRESLVPPSSGASGNPIRFDAYGSGEAPTLTGC